MHLRVRQVDVRVLVLRLRRFHTFLAGQLEQLAQRAVEGVERLLGGPDDLEAVEEAPRRGGVAEDLGVLAPRRREVVLAVGGGALVEEVALEEELLDRGDLVRGNGGAVVGDASLMLGVERTCKAWRKPRCLDLF